MDKLVVTASSLVTDANVPGARLGKRFGRMDLMSQLAVLAVESLGINFEARWRDRVGICLAASTGSLPTDVEYWNGRNRPGGPSPTLFAYTLPSAAIGEIAIRFKLTGPNLCFVGGDESILSEAADFIRRGEADAVVCVKATVVSTALEHITSMKPTAHAKAYFLKREADRS